MEKAFQKLLSKVLLKDYPIFLDVHVARTNNIMRRTCYDVSLIILEDDYETNILNSSDPYFGTKIEEYVKDLGRLMGINICGIFAEGVSEEEWEEMKNKKKD